MRKLISFIRELWRKPFTRILTSGCILTVLLLKLPLADLWSTIRQASAGLWVFVVASFICGHLAGALKWRFLINTGEAKLPYYLAIRCHFAGLFANLFLPSLAGGDIVRAGMAMRYKGEKEVIVVGSLLDRLLDTGSLILLVVIAALYSPASLGPDGRKLLFWSLLIIFALGICLVLILFGQLYLKVPGRLGHTLSRLDEALKHLKSNPAIVLRALTMSIIIQGGFVLLNALLGGACGIHLPLHVWFLTWPLAKISAMLPISMGGIGVREVALAVLLDRFDIPFSSSVGLGLLWESVLIAGSGIGGAFYLISSRNDAEARLLVRESTPGKGDSF